MRTFISIVLLAVAFGCTEAHHKAAVKPEKLYFAVEVQHEGKLVGKPRLLGETGKPLRAERRRPGSDVSDYVLVLKPTHEGGRYHLELDVSVPGARKGHTEFSLLHGEERKLELGRKPGDLAVTLTLMEVDSPEFRTLMQLMDSAPGQKSM